MYDLKRNQKISKNPKAPEIAVVHNAADVFVQVTKVSVECPNQIALDLPVTLNFHLCFENAFWNAVCLFCSPNQVMVCTDLGQKVPLSSGCSSRVVCWEVTPFACACCCSVLGPGGAEVYVCHQEGIVSSRDRLLLHSASKDVSFFELLCWHLRTDIHCSFILFIVFLLQQSVRT